MLIKSNNKNPTFGYGNLTHSPLRDLTDEYALRKHKLRYIGSNICFILHRKQSIYILWQRHYVGYASVPSLCGSYIFLTHFVEYDISCFRYISCLHICCKITSMYLIYPYPLLTLVLIGKQRTIFRGPFVMTKKQQYDRNKSKISLY